MDPILAAGLQLACVLRDSHSAAHWRAAWPLVLGYQVADAPPQMARALYMIQELRKRGAIRARPLIFPILLSRYLRLNDTQVLATLQPIPELWERYRLLREGVSVMQQLFGYLWSILPGYPHSDVIYNLTGTPWRDPISNLCLVPFGPTSLPEGNRATATSDQRRAALAASMGPAVVAHVDNFVACVRRTENWRILEAAYGEIMREPGLARALPILRQQFEREYAAIWSSGRPRDDAYVALLVLAEQLYQGQHPAITAYIAQFREYEALLARLYWLLSQLVMRQIIACLSTNSPTHLQQVAVYPGISRSEVQLTALAPTYAQTLRIGQLVHLTLAEADRALDGLYQVEILHLKATPATGARAFFRARLLWSLPADPLVVRMDLPREQPFVASEALPAADALAGIQATVIDAEGHEHDLFPPNRTLHSVDTMYF